MPAAGKRVVVLAYDGVAADEAGVVLRILGDAGFEVIVASVRSSTVTSYHGRVRPTRRVDDLIGSDVLIVPGGMGIASELGDPQLVSAIRSLAEAATWVGATSTGSVLLAAAGQVQGQRVTTHWLAQELLSPFGAIATDEPFVVSGRLLTAAGFASAAPLAFHLVREILGPDAERTARDTYQPPPRHAGPIRERRPWWRPGPRRIIERVDPLEDDSTATLITLELLDDHP